MFQPQTCYILNEKMESDGNIPILMEMEDANLSKTLFHPNLSGIGHFSNLKRKNVCISNVEDTDEVVSVSNKIKRLRIPQAEEDSIMDGVEFKIKVKTLTGKCIEVTVVPNDTILKIKELIAENEGIPADQQRLIYRGKTMADTRSAASYNLDHGSILHLVLALRGGVLTITYVKLGKSFD